MHTNEGQWKFLHGVAVEADTDLFQMTEAVKKDAHMSNMVTPHLPV